MIFFYYFFFAIGTALLSKIFLLLIQDGQMLHSYQVKVLTPLLKEKRVNLAKILGYCDICFTYWFSNLMFLFVFLPFVAFNSVLTSVTLGTVLLLFYSGFCLISFSILKRYQF